MMDRSIYAGCFRVVMIRGELSSDGMFLYIGKVRHVAVYMGGYILSKKYVWLDKNLVCVRVRVCVWVMLMQLIYSLDYSTAVV
jgi:hypothetical protein